MIEKGHVPSTGTALRAERPIFHEEHLGPWAGVVKVVPIVGGRSTLFDVVASWHGPPARMFPPDARPGDRADSYATPDQALALEVARRAVDVLRAGERVHEHGERCALDLRDIARPLVRDGRTSYVDPVLGADAPAA